MKIWEDRELTIKHGKHPLVILIIIKDLLKLGGIDPSSKLIMWRTSTSLGSKLSSRQRTMLSQVKLSTTRIKYVLACEAAHSLSKENNLNWSIKHKKNKLNPHFQVNVRQMMREIEVLPPIPS